VQFRAGKTTLAWPIPAEPTGCDGAPVAGRYFCEDFETATDLTTNWLVATNGWNTVDSTYQSPTHSVTDSPSGNYPAGAKSDMTMISSVDLTPAVSPILTFWHKLSLNSNYAYPACYPYSSWSDGTYVDVSSDGGTTWTVLTSYICSSNIMHIPAGTDYSCYKVGAAAACATGIKAGQACTATACQACGATTGTGYLDASGAVKQGFCVCSKGIWSCGTTAEWPCYPATAGATVPASCN
jgi:hypothetical protein